MTDLETIFYHIDNFCKDFEKQFEKNLLSNGKNIRKRKLSLTTSEAITISICYHLSGYKTFKGFYTKHVLIYMQNDFKNLVSYVRFIELRKKIVIPALLFLVIRQLSNCSGISFIDSFKLSVCHIRRVYSHKTLEKIASRGKTSVGWFYGMKVHLVINHKGEIVSFYITTGSTADNNATVLFKLTKDLFGKFFGDKGYIVNPEIYKKLFTEGKQLITKIRSNMKNKLMHMTDKILLKKRGIVETVGDVLKDHLNMEHTRHRSIWGFFLNIFTTLSAYQFRDKKPSIEARIEKMLGNA